MYSRKGKMAILRLVFFFFFFFFSLILILQVWRSGSNFLNFLSTPFGVSTRLRLTYILTMDTASHARDWARERKRAWQICSTRSGFLGKKKSDFLARLLCCSGWLSTWWVGRAWELIRTDCMSCWVKSTWRYRPTRWPQNLERSFMVLFLFRFHEWSSESCIRWWSPWRTVCFKRREE